MLKRIIIIGGIIVILIFIILNTLWYIFAKVMCSDDNFSAYQSANKEHSVIYFRRNCGATTTYVYNVELDGKTILRYTYGEPVSIKWLDDNSVSISMSPSPYLKTYKVLERYKNIHIIFDQNILSGYRVN